ncbi:MAG: HDOD domain-containing protein [Thermodesulfovibrionales bacterium]|nr:HDOD domain-containing protein [Thermodesulfovibrionales bacterium]
MITPEGVKLFIKGLKDLPTLPSLFRKIIIIARCDRACANDLYEMISHDQSLAEKVLKVANSPLFGLAGQVRDIRHAVMLMGFDRLKSIALGMSVMNIFPPSTSFNIRNLWVHSYEVAFIASSLSEIVFISSPRESFVAGLLHDIGRIIFYKMDPQRFLQIPTTDNMLEVEIENFGCTHAEAGAWFLEEAGLPEEIVHSVRYHHSLSEAKQFKFAVTITAVAEGFSRVFCPKIEDDGIWTDELSAAILELSIKDQEKRFIAERVSSIKSDIERFFYS